MTLSTGQDSAHRQLVESEEHYRNLVELAVDAIFMGDAQGKIIGANQSAVSLTGYSLDELLGMSLGELFSAEERDRVPLRYDLLKAGQIVQSERMLTRKDGGLVAIGMNSRMMPDGTHHTFIRDITERKADETRMLALIRELEAFTFTASHDLRTPLSSILMATEILESRCKQTLDAPEHSLLQMIANSTREMLTLVDNLLLLARAESPLRPSQPVDSNKVLAEVIDSLSLRLETTGVAIKQDPVPDLKIPETFISQIFHNLIGNALNYAGRKGETIEVSGRQQGNRVRLYVRDHGPGIPAKEHGRIFELFYRGENASEQVGSGLGLAIIAKIARAFNGQAWAEETPGGGATFCVELENT
ncbi:ATP-binding protein [Geopsychrobacter electrodiphilus]|uniref:ATP-binding protein n=1 Tax=Geopsychrobacter electrodiphilus TaxID=225196 RepID=UPI00036D59CA|nr:ATP-binding protein [Geopsychrobacter electrodiphilus]